MGKKSHKMEIVKKKQPVFSYSKKANFEVIRSLKKMKHFNQACITSYFRAGNCLPDAYVVVILWFCDGVGDITVYCQFLTLFIFELTFLFWKIATSML